jgi:hypothetical protein
VEILRSLNGKKKEEEEEEEEEEEYFDCLKLKSSLKTL